MRADFDAASALIGRRVRAVLEGNAPSVRVENGERVRAPFRVVVTGEVAGWHSGHGDTGGGGVHVEVAGFGLVPLTAVRRRRWWQR